MLFYFKLDAELARVANCSPLPWKYIDNIRKLDRVSYHHISFIIEYIDSCWEITVRKPGRFAICSNPVHWWQCNGRKQERLHVESPCYFLFQNTGRLLNHNHTNSSIRHREEVYRNLHCVKVLGNSRLLKAPGRSLKLHNIKCHCRCPNSSSYHWCTGVRQACDRLLFSQKWDERALWQDIHLLWRVLRKMKNQVSWTAVIWKLHRRLTEELIFFFSSQKLKYFSNIGFYPVEMAIQWKILDHNFSGCKFVWPSVTKSSH